MSRLPMHCRISDKQLDLTPRWFTGEQWAKGTAEEWNRREFFDAVDRFSKQGRKSKPKAKASSVPPIIAAMRGLR